MTDIIENVLQNADGKTYKYTVNNVESTIYYDTQKRASSIVTGTVGTGTVECISYDANGNFQRSDIIPYGIGLQPCGREIIKNGLKYRGIGVNFYDAVNHNDINTRFSDLKSYGVEFVRINMGQFAPGNSSSSEWRLYLSDESAWWGAIDNVVAAAELAGIGIIASMFWRFYTIPDLMLYKYGKRDALSQWGVTTSNTINFMREYTTKFVNRYKNSPVMWGWEFGNEPSVGVYQKDVTQYSLASGSPANYDLVCNPATTNGTTDFITNSTVQTALTEWASILNQCDPYKRLQSSGQSIAHVQAYSLDHNLTPAISTYAEWVTGAENGKSYFIRDNPTALNVTCSHTYTDPEQTFWYFNDIAYKTYGMVRLQKQLSDNEGKPLFIGEFGSVSGYPGSGSTLITEQNQYYNLINAIVDSQVPLSCVWNYGYLPNVPLVTRWNIDSSSFATATNPVRDYQLQALAQANARLRSTL